MSMRVSVLVPYNPSSSHWERMLARTQDEWNRQIARDAGDLDIEVVVGVQRTPGAMRVAECVNRAAAVAGGDVFALWGADHWPDVRRLRWTVETMERTGSAWQPMFQHTAILSRATTELILAGQAEATEERATWADSVPMCVGILAIGRAAFEDVGGEDERFVGWGMEDAALREALDVLHGTPPEGPDYGAVLLSMWHPVQNHDDGNAKRNVEIYASEYLAAKRDPVAMRAVLDRARDWRLRAG